MNKRWMVGIALIAALTGCKKDNTTGSAGNPFENAAPLVTAFGEALSEITTYRVDAGASTISSPDGKLDVMIPAGAFESNTTLSIQAITNLAPLGLGNAYRLGPEAVHFNKPLTLRFHYDDNDLGTAIEDFLWVATQEKDGTWSGYRKATVDKVGRTVSVEVTHFSDWTIGRFMDLTIAPSSGTVKYGETLVLTITGFLQADENDEVLVPLSPVTFGPETKVSQEQQLLAASEQYLSFDIKNWTVNGGAGGGAFGWLEPGGLQAVYHAPGAVPTPPKVTIGVNMTAHKKNLENAQYILVAEITVVGAEYYLRLTVDGKDYFYVQYGVGGQLAPDPTNFQMVNCGMQDDGSVGIAAGYYNGGNITYAFAANFLNTAVGTHSLSCYLDNNNADDITFTPGTDALSYTNYLTKRTQKQDYCDSESQCASLTSRFVKFGETPMSEVEGSFSGKLYYDGPDFGDQCKSSEEHVISGAFRLMRLN